MLERQPTGTVTISGTTATKYELDVTAYVQAQNAAGHNVICFTLKDLSSSTSVVVLNSREAASQGPALVIS